MIRYTAEGTQTNFNEMVRYLANYPKTLDRAAIGGMKKTVGFAYKFILPRIPVRTGAARGVFFQDVLGFGGSLTGVVGFRGGGGAPYHINIVEHGARPHSLKAKSKSRSEAQRRRFESRVAKGTLKGQHINVNGTWVTVAKHPGFSKRGFMAAGFSAAQPIFNKEMQSAVDKAFQEITNK